MSGPTEIDMQAEWNALDRGETTAPERLDVYQDGERIGSLPGNFGERSARSTSMMYDVRPGDFRREGDRIIAHSSLGYGDLQAAGVAIRR